MTYDTALAALADPTRRHVFERLRSGPRSVGAIARGMHLLELPVPPGLDGVGTPMAAFSKSHTLPAGSPVNASTSPLGFAA